MKVQSFYISVTQATPKSSPPLGHTHFWLFAKVLLPFIASRSGGLRELANSPDALCECVKGKCNRNGCERTWNTARDEHISAQRLNCLLLTCLNDLNSQECSSGALNCSSESRFDDELCTVSSLASQAYRRLERHSTTPLRILAPREFVDERSCDSALQQLF